MATATAPKSSIFVNSVPTNFLWATLLLKNIGAPVTPNNINNVLRWQAAENPPASWYNRNNPLNASLGTNKGDGTGVYSDLTTAAKETATMIVQGYKGGAIGGGIYTALMNNAPTDQFSIQVVNSNWSSNHYGVAAAGSNVAVPGRQATWFTSIPAPGVVAASNADVNEGTAPAGSGIASPATVSADAAANAGVPHRGLVKNTRSADPRARQTPHRPVGGSARGRLAEKQDSYRRQGFHDRQPAMARCAGRATDRAAGGP